MDFVTETSLIDTQFLTFGITSLLKFVFSFLLILYVIYSLFLALRVRILVDSIRTPWNPFLRKLAFFHLYAVIICGGVALLLIIMA